MRKKISHLIAGVSAGALLLTALFLLLGGMHTNAAPAAIDTAAVRQAAGVALSPGYSQEGEPGTVVAYTHVLTNTGTNTDTFDLEATNSRGWSVTLAGGNWPTGTALLPLTVSGSATSTFIVSVTIPATATLNITASTFITATPQAASADTTTDITIVGRHTYLPLGVRDYSPFANGDFESGLSGWNTGQGPFPLNGHGGGMPQSVVLFEGNHRALLGEPNAPNRSIPVGYGCISQTFTVDQRYLRLEYRVISYDVVTGAKGYYDTFEVSVDRPPAQVSDTERNAQCISTALNPEGTLVVSDAGLVFCGGRSGASSVAGTQWDSGWRTVTLDLNNLLLQGRNITLYISIWSREYDSPYYNDRAWYNTWAYVDNLSLQE